MNIKTLKCAVDKWIETVCKDEEMVNNSKQIDYKELLNCFEEEFDGKKIVSVNRAIDKFMEDCNYTMGLRMFGIILDDK